MALRPDNPAAVALAAMAGPQPDPARGLAAAEAIALLSADALHQQLAAAGDATATSTWTRLVLRLIDVREQHLPPPK